MSTIGELNDHIKNVCKIGQKHDCCRYLTGGKDGFYCEKNTDLRFILDERVMLGTITARGDNCEGWKNAD